MLNKAKLDRPYASDRANRSANVFLTFENLGRTKISQTYQLIQEQTQLTQECALILLKASADAFSHIKFGAMAASGEVRLGFQNVLHHRRS